METNLLDTNTHFKSFYYYYNIIIIFIDCKNYEQILYLPNL